MTSWKLNKNADFSSMRLDLDSMFEEPVSELNETIIQTSTEESELATKSTVTMPPEIVTSAGPPIDDQIEWKIISFVFIALTAVLFVVSVCLWRAMPSSKSKKTATLPRTGPTQPRNIK